MRVLFFVLVMAFFPFVSAQANHFTGCTITEVVAVPNSPNSHVELNCTITSLPACAAASNYFAFDKSTADGRTTMALVLSAFAANQKVSGNINASCPAWQNNVALLQSIRLRK